MYRIQQSSPLELDAIAACHKACFPQSLSVKLGRGYRVKSMEWFLVDENRFLVHVTDDGKVVGYCGGFVSRYHGDGSASGIIQYAMAEAMKGVLLKPWLLLNKEVIAMYPLIKKNIQKKVFGAKRKPSAKASVKSVEQLKAGLVVIGVHPDYRGKGIFELLMTGFEKQTIERGLSKMALSVKASNQRAIKAYSKAGWKAGKENGSTLEMTKEIV